MKFILSLLSFLMIAGVLAGVSGFIWGWGRYTGPGPAAEPKIFMVGKGEGVSTIAGNLSKASLISNPYLFQIAARLEDKDKKLHAGEYEIPAHASMREILDKMARGDVVQHRVTLREGLTSWQVVQILNEADFLEGEIAWIPAEGTLLPDTYLYARGDTRQAKLDEMAAAMQRAIAELWPGRDPGISVLSEREAVTLASIVEKETGVAAERARIAGVFHNRLKLGMPLQSDPTVIYALTNGKIEDKGMGPLGRRLLRDDLQFASPYNTYKNAGLPPGPIANPGIDSIRAVLNPEKHDYLYFVADGTGGHVFSKTLDEHNANAAKWREVRKQMKQ